MRRAAKSSEHQEQAAVIRWWSYGSSRCGLPEFALMAIPNAAKRSYALANRMKMEGLRKGIPDLFLAVPSNLANAQRVYGLWIEMKKKPNKPSTEQIEVLSFLQDKGYFVQVCYSADEAIKAIKEYLK